MEEIGEQKIFSREALRPLSFCALFDSRPGFSAERSLPALTILPRSARIIEASATGVDVSPNKWACGAAGSALPWHGRGRRFDPDQVHQFPSQFRLHDRL